MKKLTTILFALLVLTVGSLFVSCATRQQTPVPTVPTVPPATTVPDTQPQQTEPTSAVEETTQSIPVLEDVQLPQTWVANCEEYIGLRSAPDGESVQRILKGESMELLSWDGRYAFVEYQGQTGYVLSSYIKPQDGLEPLQLQVVAPTDQYTYEQMISDMNVLAARYPDRLTIQIIGTSVQGRDIPVLRMGDADAPYHVLFQGSIHAREHMNSWLLMSVAEYWLSRDGEPLADVCFHIIPMVNPDGVTISQTGTLDEEQMDIYLNDSARGYTSDSSWYYAQTWKANALGTDLNRNFPADWESLTQILEPSSAGYRGDFPFSAPEAAALRYYTLAWDFDVTLSYHSSGSLIYWQYGNKQPVNQQSLSLAKALEAYTGYTPTGNYDNSRAGYKDWVMDSLGIPSVTVEIGCGDSPLNERELYSIFYRNYRVLPAIARWLKEE